jgi:hypothetical protein
MIILTSPNATDILELFTNAAAGYQRMFKPVKEVAD